MARERQETVIDGYKYEMTMLGATASYRLFHRLFKMLGPSFGALMNSVADGVTDVADIDLGSEVVAQGIRALTDSVKESDLDHLIDTLKKQTHAGVEEDSEKTVPLSGTFDVHFQGRIGSMFKWVWWGLTVQYRDFSSAFASLKSPSAGEESPAATETP